MLNFLKPLILVLSLALSAQEPQDWFVQPGGTLRIDAGAPGVTTEVALNGGVPLAAQEIMAPTSGVHMLMLLARDQVGNAGKPQWYRVVVDGEGPQLNLKLVPSPVIDANDVAWVPPGTRVLLNGHDPLSGLVRLDLSRNDQVETTELAQLTLQLEQPGAQVLKAEGWDKVGNHHRVNQTVHVDGQPPEVTIEVTGTHARHNDLIVLGKGAGLKLNARDTQSGLTETKVQMNGESQATELWAKPTREGRHLAGATAKDRVGNEGATTLPFVLDLTPPEISVELQGNHVERSGTRYYKGPVTLITQANDAIFGNVPARFVSGEDSDRLVAERGPVLIEATDGVGNRAEKQVTWEIDETPPSIIITDEGGQTIDDSVTLPVGRKLFLEVTDQQSGPGEASYRFDKGKPLPLPAFIRFDRRGRFQLNIALSDQLGNTTTVSRSVRVTR